MSKGKKVKKESLLQVNWPRIVSKSKKEMKVRTYQKTLTSFLDLSSSELKLLSSKAKKRLRTMKLPMTSAGRKIAKQVPVPWKCQLFRYLPQIVGYIRDGK